MTRRNSNSSNGKMKGMSSSRLRQLAEGKAVNRKTVAGNRYRITNYRVVIEFPN